MTIRSGGRPRDPRDRRQPHARPYVEDAYATEYEPIDFEPSRRDVIRQGGRSGRRRRWQRLPRPHQVPRVHPGPRRRRPGPRPDDPAADRGLRHRRLGLGQPGRLEHPVREGARARRHRRRDDDARPRATRRRSASRSRRATARRRSPSAWRRSSCSRTGARSSSSPTSAPWRPTSRRARSRCARA